MVLRTYSWPITDERTYKAALRAAGAEAGLTLTQIYSISPFLESSP